MKQSGLTMVLLSIVARTACILLGLFSLYGRILIGGFTAGMFAGFMGFIAALIPTSRLGTTIMLLFVVLGLLCQVSDVMFYYFQTQIPGNDYWWPGSIVYFTILIFMGVFAVLTRRRLLYVV